MFAITALKSGLYDAKTRCLAGPVTDFMDDPGLYVWTILHEYMHKFQVTTGYLKFPENRDNGRFSRFWYDSLHVAKDDMTDSDYGRLPWEAEADSFANTNVRHVCSMFGGIEVRDDTTKTHQQLEGRFRPSGSPNIFKHPQTWSYSTKI